MLIQIPLLPKLAPIPSRESGNLYVGKRDTLGTALVQPIRRPGRGNHSRARRAIELKLVRLLPKELAAGDTSRCAIAAIAKQMSFMETRGVDF